MSVGDVVMVTNKNSKDNGDMAVIGMVTNKQFFVRSTQPTPILNKIKYRKNRAHGAEGKYQTYL